MSKTLVIGAGGKIGTILVSQLADLNRASVAMVRDKNKCSFPESIEVVEADLEHDVKFAMEGCSSVVFTAGSGGHTGLDKTLLVDLWGACKAIDAAKECGIQHFMMVSARGADNPDLGLETIKPYLVAKHFADKHLIGSGLNYTILRPGRLTDEAGTGLIKTVRPENREEQFIAREDVARVIVHCLQNEAVLGKIYELYDGSEKIVDVIN